MKVRVNHYQKGKLIESVCLYSKSCALKWIETTKSEKPFKERIKAKQFFQIQRTLNF